LDNETGLTFGFITFPYKLMAAPLAGAQPVLSSAREGSMPQLVLRYNAMFLQMSLWSNALDFLKPQVMRMLHP
jgi:hypothetical protein